MSRKTLPWLFSQASGVPTSQSHHADNKARIFEISDDSESDDNMEAASGELRNDLSLSDPISDFPISHVIFKVGKGRATKNFIAEGKEVPTVPRERSRSPVSSRSGLSRQVLCSQCSDSEKKDPSLTAREVGPAVRTNYDCAPTEREVGPADMSDIGVGSSAREVGPAADPEEIQGPAEREVGPAAIPGCVLSDSNKVTWHGSHSKTKLGKYKYGITSLFDGVSSVVGLLTKKLGCPPTILLAENDEASRRLVCTEFGYLFFLLHAAKVRSSCEGPGQSALQSAYHDPKLDLTELKQHRTP